MNLLVIEDEVRLAEALVQILQKNKYTALAAYDGITGLDHALTGIYDVIILDIMLPKLNGLEVLKELRTQKIQTPVILLTAKDEVSDRVKGLDHGADDYLIFKSFVIFFILLLLLSTLGSITSNALL